MAKPQAHRPLLSVGMIVKNEEKHLPRCLAALKPFLEKVDSELVIIDTGSTDRTVEIAKQYTEKVHFFQWRDDFAAARNETLKYSRGQWYLALDADEILDEDYHELLEFFTTPLHKKYNGAAFLVRSYADEKWDYGTDAYCSRIRRLAPGICYTGKIHEMMPEYPPTRLINTVFHHEGYFDAIFAEKTKRNIPLLEKELEKEPDSTRILRHLADCYTFASTESVEKKLALLERARELEKDKKDGFLGSVYRELLRTYMFLKKYEECDAVFNEYFILIEGDHIIDMEMYYFKSFYKTELKQYEEVLKSSNEYIRLYKRYINHELDTFDVLCGIYSKVNEETYKQVIVSCALVSYELDDYAKMRNYLDLIDCVNDLDANGLPRSLQAELYYANGSRNMVLLPKLYEQFTEKDDPMLLAYYWGEFERIFVEKNERRYQACRELGTAQVDDTFTAVCRLRSMKEWETELISPQIDIILENPDAQDNKIFYQDAIYHCLCAKSGVERLMDAADPTKLLEMCSNIATSYMDFPNIVRSYFERAEDGDTLKRQNWQIVLLGQALVAAKDIVLHKQEYIQLFERFSKLLITYCKQIYAPGMLTAGNVDLLPKLHQTAYYLENIFLLRSEKNVMEYIKVLKKLLKVYPALKGLISLMLEEAESMGKEKDEFTELAMKIKQQIGTMLANGKTVEAGEIVRQYETVNPQDPDIKNLKELVGLVG